MALLYWKVLTEACRRLITSWPAALSLLVYPLLLFPASLLAAQLGIVGGFLIGFVVAACWSSYLELISQAVSGARFRLDFEEFKRTFGARFWDVISVMFAFWLISLVSGLLTQGSHGPALSGVIGFAIAFFFNVVPELLYQGNSRSFALLQDSARFVMEHPVAWFTPNLVFATLALWAGGALSVQHPVELLIVFGQTFSSPLAVAGLFARINPWFFPLALALVHFVMLFRGVLFRELSSGGGNARLRAFRASMR